MRNKYCKKIQRQTQLRHSQQPSHIHKSHSSNKNPKNQLSLSFYHHSTLRQHKQIILDFPLDFNDPPKTHSLETKAKEGQRGELKQSQVLGGQSPRKKQRDSVDFTTTQASKMNCFEGLQLSHLKAKEGKCKTSRQSRSKPRKEGCREVTDLLNGRAALGRAGTGARTGGAKVGTAGRTSAGGWKGR